MIPAKPVNVLSKGDNKISVSKEEQNNYRSGVWKDVTYDALVNTRYSKFCLWMFDYDDFYNEITY